MVGRGFLFQSYGPDGVSAPTDDTVNYESVVGVKSGDSSVLIWYQVDEFTCI